MRSGPTSGEAEERSGGASGARREESICGAPDTRGGAEQTTGPAADALWTDERGSGGAQRGSFRSEEGREHLLGGGHARRSRAECRRRTREAEPSRVRAADPRGGAEQSALHNCEAAQTCTISPVRGLPVG